jgi:hypothetical protein
MLSSHKFESLKWAWLALRFDLLEFWVENPLELVPTAGPRDSLRYYVFSSRLSWSEMELDPCGVPMYLGRVWGRTYCPTDIAWYGLVKLQEHLLGLNSAGRSIFMTQAAWLMEHHHDTTHAGVVWPYTIDWQEGPCSLKAPWPSAICQGHAISALVRAFRVTGDPRYLDVCRRATVVFGRDILDGGICHLVDGHVVYAEYPGHPTPRVLDGFLVSLLGLYDLLQETGDGQTRTLLEEGVDGLKHLLPYWTYRQKWTWYGSRSYLCPRGYHTSNRLLLLSLARVLDDPTLFRYAALWDIDRLTTLARLEVFFVLIVTKNLSRYRNRTWRQRTVLPAGPERYRLPREWQTSGPVAGFFRRILS